MHRKAGLMILTLAAVAIILVGCSGGGDAPALPDGGSGGTVDTSGSVRILLTDAPAAALSEVWVNILRVELVPEDEGPIVVLESGELPAQFELLSLAADPFELGVVEAPVGAYDQVRLVLAADGHYLVDAEGGEHQLRVPSGAQSGVKVVFPDGGFVVDEGQTTLLLDFLAAPSVHQAGQSGQWIMRPVIHGSTPEVAEPAFGTIEGTVAFEDETIPQPLETYPPAVFVVGEEALYIGEIDPETGAFEIPSLLVGTYELHVGWLSDESEMLDGELLIVTGESLIEGIGITVESGTPLELDLTVSAGADDGMSGDDSPDGDEGDEA